MFKLVFKWDNYSTFLYLWRCIIIANNSRDLLINDQIRCSQVRLIGPGGEEMGIKSLNDALVISSYAGLDLVLMNENANPPLCKVMDYNKFKYEKQKRVKEQQKKQRLTNVEIKEYRLSPVIDVGDFETKARNASKALGKGDKAKVTIRFKGRQLAHTEIGREVLLRFAERLADIAEIESDPKMDGRSMIMMLIPKKEVKEN